MLICRRPFAGEKQQQWSAFLRRLGGDVPDETDFASVVAGLEEFLGKAVSAINEQHEEQLWRAGGPWRPAETGA